MTLFCWCFYHTWFRHFF